ncbi:MAG: hypothetical protein ACLVJU_01595 [Blautia sp.]
MSINGTLAFVILWIVNALIALVYLLVGIFLYVPACDLKREQGRRFSTTIGEHFLFVLSSWFSARSSVRHFFCAVI